MGGGLGGLGYGGDFLSYPIKANHYCHCCSGQTGHDEPEIALCVRTLNLKWDSDVGP